MKEIKESVTQGVTISDKTRELNLVFIAILETERNNSSDSTLKNLCAGKIFLWYCNAP
jgi:hypothetical protein